MQKQFRISPNVPRISDLVVMPENAEFTDYTHYFQESPKKVATVCNQVLPSENLFDLVKKNIPSKYLKLERINPGKCYKILPKNFIVVQTEEKVDDTHIFTIVFTSNNNGIDESIELRSRSAILFEQFIRTGNEQIYLFDPNILTSIHGNVNNTGNTYIFKVFGKMNWYDYMVDNNFIISKSDDMESSIDFVAQIIARTKDKFERIKTTEIKDNVEFFKNYFSLILYYSHRYEYILLKIYNLMGLLKVEQIPGDIDTNIIDTEFFIPKSIYHVVFADNTEKEFTEFSKINGNIKSIELKNLGIKEQIIHYLNKIRIDVYEKYEEYLKNLDASQVLSDIKKSNILPGRVYSVALSRLYAVGISYDELHIIDKKIYDYFRLTSHAVTIKNVRDDHIDINIFQESPFQTIIDDCMCAYTHQTSYSCLIIMLKDSPKHYSNSRNNPTKIPSVHSKEPTKCYFRRV
jgi:hypothetical protein